MTVIGMSARRHATRHEREFVRRSTLDTLPAREVAKPDVPAVNGGLPCLADLIPHRFRVASAHPREAAPGARGLCGCVPWTPRCSDPAWPGP